MKLWIEKFDTHKMYRKDNCNYENGTSKRLLVISNYKVMNFFCVEHNQLLLSLLL